MFSCQLVYVTGSHRSGTPWAGRMVAATNRALVKDEEIFNIETHVTRSPITCVYQHIHNENSLRNRPA